MTDRQIKIIHATLELAAENGLGTVSMQQIADRIGITKASLYNHFSSRVEIINAMYLFLRQASREKAGANTIDYDKLSENMSLEAILTESVSSYQRMVSDPEMLLFYRIIMSERTISRAAAEIMTRETKTMIDATKTLFYALQIKKIADFVNVDAAAFSFAMAVHSMIDYQFDRQMAGLETGQEMIRDYISEFCRIYSISGGNKDGK